VPRYGFLRFSANAATSRPSAAHYFKEKISKRFVKARMSKERKAIYEFAGFRLDPEERQLLNHGEAVDLTPKALSLLVVFVENAGRLLAKDKLKEKVWPDTHVDDANLTVTVRALRVALGNGSNGSRDIETVPREGYRFIESVKRIEPADQAADSQPWEDPALIPRTPLTSPAPCPDEEQAAHDPLSIPRKTRLRSTWLLAACAGLLLVLATTFAGFIFPPSQPVILKYTQLTYEGREIGEVLPTDGVRVYFQEKLADKELLGAVPASGTGEPAYLTAPTKTPVLLGMFPGGEGLLVASGFPLATFWKLPMPGGAPQPLANMSGVGIALSPDGRRYARVEDNHSLTIEDLDSGASRRIFSSNRSVISRASWSPDGSMLCFTQLAPEAAKGADVYSIWSINADGSNLRQMVSPKVGILNASFCSWTPGAKYLLFSSPTNGKSDLWAIPDRANWFPFAHPKPVRLTATPVEFYAPTASLDGKKIFALGRMERGELVRHDRKAGAWLPFVGGMSAGALDFSRDGQWVAYVKHPEGTLWRSRVDGSDPLQLTFGPNTTDGPHWSPDGRQIAFRSSLPGQPRRIFLISANGGVPRELLPGNENRKEEGIPTWSGDGRSIAFGELRYDVNNIAIHIMELATGQVSTVPGSEGLWTPRWSPSGRCMLALKSGGAFSNSPALLLFDFRTNQWRTLAERQINEPVWSHDEKYIYFDVVQSQTDDAIWRVRVADGKTERVVSIIDFPRAATPSFGTWFGLAPDDSPLMLREIHETEIFALDVKW
jgi:DNA-binding winged helix-turn-helix (wHTH) protein/Tol biopolymer transport system component